MAKDLESEFEKACSKAGGTVEVRRQEGSDALVCTDMDDVSKIKQYLGMY